MTAATTDGETKADDKPGPADDAPHILVVDDDRRIRELLKRYLADNGFRVTTAENAAEARTRLAGLSFDLLVLDVMMPGESGLDLTRDLRRTSTVPILMLTARGEEGDRIDGLDAGADDYLAKPFEPRELILRIRTILRRAQAPGTVKHDEISLGPCRFNVTRGELWNGDTQIRLTTREVQLMRIFAANPHRLCHGWTCATMRGWRAHDRRPDQPAAAQTRRRSQKSCISPDRARRRLRPDARLTVPEMQTEVHTDARPGRAKAAPMTWHPFQIMKRLMPRGLYGRSLSSSSRRWCCCNSSSLMFFWNVTGSS